MKISIEEKKVEAIRRMKKMGVYNETIRQFEKAGLISRSEPPFGVFYWVEDEDLEAVRKFEEKHNALVYMVIRSYFGGFSMMDSYLFVEDERDEWAFFDNDMSINSTFTYTISYDDPDYSEFGSIGIKMGIAGGPVRTA